MKLPNVLLHKTPNHYNTQIISMMMMMMILLNLLVNRRAQLDASPIGLAVTSSNKIHPDQEDQELLATNSDNEPTTLVKAFNEDDELGRTMSRLPSLDGQQKAFNELIDFDPIGSGQAAKGSPLSGDKLATNDVSIWSPQEQQLAVRNTDNNNHNGDSTEFGNQAEQSEQLESRYVNVASKANHSGEQQQQQQQFSNQTSLLDAGQPHPGAGAATASVTSSTTTTNNQNKTETDGINHNQNEPKKKTNKIKRLRYKPQLILKDQLDWSRQQQQQQQKMVSYMPNSGLATTITTSDRPNQHGQSDIHDRPQLVYDPISAQSMLIRLVKTFDQQLNGGSGGEPRRLLIPVAQFNQLMNPIRGPQLRQPSARFSSSLNQDLATQTSNTLFDSTVVGHQRGPFHLVSGHQSGGDTNPVESNQETVHSTGPSPSIAPAELMQTIDGSSTSARDLADHLVDGDSDTGDGDNDSDNDLDTDDSPGQDSSSSRHKSSSVASTISIVQRTNRNESTSLANGGGRPVTTSLSTDGRAAGSDLGGRLGQELLVGPFKSEAEAPATITLAGVVYQKSGSSSALVKQNGQTMAGRLAKQTRNNNLDKGNLDADSSLSSNKGNRSVSSLSSLPSPTSMATGGNTLAPLIVQGPPPAAVVPTTIAAYHPAIKSVSSSGNILLGSIDSTGPVATVNHISEQTMGQLPQSGIYSTGQSSFLSNLASLTGQQAAYFVPDDMNIHLLRQPSLEDQVATKQTSHDGSTTHGTLTTGTTTASGAGAIWVPHLGPSKQLPTSAGASSVDHHHHNQLEQLIASSSASSSSSSAASTTNGHADLSLNQLTSESEQHYNKHHKEAKAQQGPIVIVQKDVKPVKYHLLRAYLKLRRLLRPFEATYVFPNDSSSGFLRRLLTKRRQ